MTLSFSDPGLAISYYEMLFQLSPFFIEFGHEEEFDLESSTMPGVAAEADHQSTECWLSTATSLTWSYS
jgi:hypothetical protein